MSKQFHIPGVRVLWQLQPSAFIQHDFFVFDTETGKQKTKGKNTVIDWELNARPDAFVFGVVYGHNFTKVIHDRKEMVLEFQKPMYKGKKVFAHNFGGFDGSVLFDNIFDMDPKAIFIGSRFISCTNGNCMFVDSLNIYKTSVKEIGKKMGLLKLGMDEGNYKQSVWPRDKARDINGCIRDCQIIFDALLEVFGKAGKIAITIGSLAMQYYRRFQQPYHIEHKPEHTKYFWESYYGGRTEVFKLGPTNAKVIDVNSQYPYAMKVTKYPNPKFLKVEEMTDLATFKKSILHHYEGLAYCTVKHPATWLGLLPCRVNKKLIFPVGTFSGCWNFNELRFAVENGVKIIGVSKVVYAEAMESPFVSFVDTLYLDKFLANKEGRSLDEWVAKYLMNNLYGKFGQRIDEETIYINDVENQYDLIRSHQQNNTFVKLIPFNADRSDAFLIVKSPKKIEIAYSIPSFSSYITSAGRVMLAKKLLEMKHNRPVYCDTDSIFFEIDNGVPSSSILGEWKIEDKTVTEIRGLKNYKFVKDGKQFSRIKGVPSRAVMVEVNRYEYETLTGNKEALRRNIDAGILTKRTKVITGKYEKRKVLTNGETEPIEIC